MSGEPWYASSFYRCKSTLAEKTSSGSQQFTSDRQCSAAEARRIRPVRTWPEARQDYDRLVSAVDWDARYLRERGLIPNIRALLGQCEMKSVLDAGTGTGWLFEHIHPDECHACDLVRPESLPKYVQFRQCDVCDTGYDDEAFDVVVASLLLMFCPDLNVVLREFSRISKGGSSLIVALVHPYFYRTGDVLPSGDFALSMDLSTDTDFAISIGKSVEPVRYFYRPYPVYLNAFVDAGWRIEETRDWFIEMADYRRRRSAGMKSHIRRSGGVPLYSFIRATKG